MKDNESKYWKAEYENLRRKKNKEIEKLKLKMAKANHDYCDYLTFKGLDQEFLQWKEYQEWMKTNGYCKTD